MEERGRGKTERGRELEGEEGMEGGDKKGSRGRVRVRGRQGGGWSRGWNGREEGRSKATTVGFYGAITRNWVSLLRQQEYDASGSISSWIVCLRVFYESIN